MFRLKSLVIARIVGLVVAAVLLSVASHKVLAQKVSQMAQADAIQTAISTILNAPERLPFHLQRVRKSLTAHYIDNAAPPYWINNPGHVSQFVQRMVLADDDGLKPTDYPADYLINLRSSVDSGDPLAVAYTELTFSSFFIRYASDVKTGRFVPQKIDPDLFQPKRNINQVALLTAMQKAKSPVNLLDRYNPHNRHYRALKPLLTRYRAIVEQGGWQKIPFGPTLKPGMSDERIPMIRARLEKSGDLAPRPSPTPQMYSPDLAAAVQSYQRRVGLNDEGIIGKLSLIQMNISARERLRQIVVNMERWRWMPENMGINHIMVNIAAFELYRIKKNRLVETVNVVVGKEYHQTPVFSDKMEYVVLNPTWTVPFSIATKEILPKLQKDPSYLKDDFEILQNGSPVSPWSIDWSQYSTKNFPYTFRQRPGPKNALGQVKFMLPNKHAIYLHDTPSKSLFRHNKRAFSHGCVRVHKPLAFADTILSAKPGWSPKRIRKVLDSRELTQVNLPDHLPVHIVYATVWAGKNGTINFRPDVYGRDKKLYRALFAKPTS